MCDTHAYTFSSKFKRLQTINWSKMPNNFKTPVKPN